MSDARTRNTNIRRVGGALLAFVQQIETAYERSASSNKLHPTDFRAICLLRASRKPMSPKQLGAALGLAPGAVSALIYRLEVRGFVFREANPAEPHGRRIVLDEGVAAIAMKNYQTLRDLHGQATDTMSDRELATIADYLEKVRKIMARHVKTPDL